MILTFQSSYQLELQPQALMCSRWLEVPCLHTTQIIDHIKCLIQHGGTLSITGQLLDGTIEQAKVELGVSGPLLTQPYEIYGHLLMESWIKGVWNEVSDNNIQVTEKTASL